MENAGLVFPKRCGYLGLEFENLVDAVAGWTRGLYHRVELSPVEGDICEALSLVSVENVPTSRYLVCATNSGWSACFSNGFGGDVTSLIGCISESYACTGVIITAYPNKYASKKPNEYAAYQFSLFSGEVVDYSNLKRSIICMNDGGHWIFETSGEIQEFEDPTQYLSKKIADRFTLELLERYCRAIGIIPFDVSFYNRQGVILEFSEPK